MLVHRSFQRLTPVNGAHLSFMLTHCNIIREPGQKFQQATPMEDEQHTVLHRPQLDDLHNIHTHLDRVLQASLLTFLDVACQACACSAALASISVECVECQFPRPVHCGPVQCIPDFTFISLMPARGPCMPYRSNSPVPMSGPVRDRWF